MSHTVLRGVSTASQLYLDRILDAVIRERKHENQMKGRDQLNLAEIIYYCLMHFPDAIYMVNGSSGKSLTNREMLQYSVALSHAIGEKQVEGRCIMFIMRNHEQMAALFYAALFTDVQLMMIDPNSTEYEIRHFIQLVQPNMVFCDTDRYNDILEALNHDNNTSDVSVFIADDNDLLKKICANHWSKLNNFRISKASSESIVLLSPTSGSSGLPKATLLTHCGLIAQLPTIWSHHSFFPRPTERVLLLSSAQWITYTLLMTTCPVFGVSLIMTPRKPTTDHVLEIIEKFQPTLTLLSPALFISLTASGTEKQLSSLETVIVTGAPLAEKDVMSIKQKLPAAAHICNGMGMTETHGFITMPPPGTVWQSNGKIVNTLIYKIVAEDGTELDVNQKGELYIKSGICLFRGYYKNEQAYRETVTVDGWYKTGDVFYRNECDEVYFVERKKFWFKYLNYQIAPEELEKIIFSVPGVKECVVCDSKKGPAALIVLQSNKVPLCVETSIHKAINKTLSDYKRLRGGVYFLSSLPRTHSGKLKRLDCEEMVKNLT